MKRNKRFISASNCSRLGSLANNGFFVNIGFFARTFTAWICNSVQTWVEGKKENKTKKIRQGILWYSFLYVTGITMVIKISDSCKVGHLTIWLKLRADTKFNNTRHIEQPCRIKRPSTLSFPSHGFGKIKPTYHPLTDYCPLKPIPHSHAPTYNDFH